MPEITATDVFTFVNELFTEEIGDDNLRTAVEVIMQSTKQTDPKQLVRSFSIVVNLYQRFCVEQISQIMSAERNSAVSQLHEASIIAQGGH